MPGTSARAADTAQLFRVEIGTFTPVSRAETGRRNTRDVWNWMDFLIGDKVPLERMAVLSAELASSVIGGDLGRSFETYVPGSVMNPMCQHNFRAAGMDVKLSYRRTELPNWQALQADVTAFLTCATSKGL
jgi:hypothetical protein